MTRSTLPGDEMSHPMRRNPVTDLTNSGFRNLTTEVHRAVTLRGRNACRP
jgi:hypothetical protein